jgi:UDP-N-acetylglucosamine transferase subunit ALG13
MLSQLPRLINAISSEKVWLDEMQRKYCWDFIVSDNRYGIYHASARSILVTHQLYPTFWKVRLPDVMLHHMHRRLMRPFDEVWIPDAAGAVNLSGDLSHPPAKGMTCHYIGPLSRLHPAVGEPPFGLRTGQYLLALVSGPEPQRSILEGKILASVDDFQKPVVLVRGLPGSADTPAGKERLTIINHADPSTLASLVVHAGWVVCRSGYSTVMDLVRLGKRALLVPTPGQTEQEYLADYLQDRGFFPAMPQAVFTLEAALEKLQAHGGWLPVIDFAEHQSFLAKRFVQTGNPSQPYHEPVT